MFYHCENMRTQLKRIGNSQGVIIPKPLLAQAGITRDIEIIVENETIMIRGIRPVREGWAEAMEAITASGEPAAWPDFPNDSDDEWVW
jgi:antitoxin MazE